MHEGLHSNRLGLRGVPAAAEEIIVARDIILAKHTGGRLHFSAISTSGAVALIRQAKAEGLAITADTHPHYFTLTADHISTYDANYKVFPPLRMDADVDAIIEGLADGTIDAISSGHFPQSESAKQQVFELAAPGMISLETTLSLSTTLVNKKKISPERMIQLLSTAPAQILGMENEMGSLQVGKWADITIFDPQSKFTYAPEKSKGGCRNTPFYGQKLSGAVRYCIVSGAIVSRGLV
jgi:dihydroorotase